MPEAGPDSMSPTPLRAAAAALSAPPYAWVMSSGAVAPSAASVSVKVRR